MDVTLGEMAALCDYSNNMECRSNIDFLSAVHSTCILCGPINDTEHGTQAAVRHLECSTHKLRAQQYYTCQKHLLTLERRNIITRASQREIILVYFGERIAQSNVIRGIGNYNSTALAFLQKRATAPELIRVFGEITASENNPKRGVCSICMERPSTVMFEDCKHVCICAACEAKVSARAEESQALPMCPICRKRSKTVHVFIS